jgi:hypothetical protein
VTLSILQFLALSSGLPRGRASKSQRAHPRRVALAKS